jgi:hypothetical protein
MKLINAVVAAAATLLVSTSSAWADEAPVSNKWRIEVSEGANSDGTLLFRITPAEGAAIDVPVSIKDGRRENGIAQDIRDTLRKTLDAKSFHVETDDGEDVLVKRKKGPQFSVALVESTTTGVRINIEKE